MERTWTSHEHLFLVFAMGEVAITFSLNLQVGFKLNGYADQCSTYEEDQMYDWHSNTGGGRAVSKVSAGSWRS